MGSNDKSIYSDFVRKYIPARSLRGKKKVILAYPHRRSILLEFLETQLYAVTRDLYLL